MKRSASFAIFLFLASCGTRQTNDTRSAPPEALALVRQADGAFAHFGVPRTGPAGLDVRVPLRSDLALTVRARGDEARGLAIKPIEVARVNGRKVEGAMLFADVAPATDLLYAHDGDRVEEVRVLRESRAPSTFRWEIEVGRSIVDLRVRDGRIEGVDVHGRVMVQAGQPFAVDHAGKRRSLTTSIAKKGELFVLTASLDVRGLSFPVVVDPVWIGGPTMTSPRSNHTAAIDTTGTVWIGCGSGSGFEKFDPATDTFSSLPSAPSSPASCAITFVGSKVVVAGSGQAMSFDKSTSTWTAGASATNTNTQSFAVGLADGKILLMGGSLASSASSSVEVYDPVANTWTTKAPLKVARYDAMAVRLASGKVLVAGGEDFGGALSSAEVYDPVADTWTATSPMSVARYDGAIARLASGKVILAGGHSPVDKSTVIFDPTSNSFSDGPTLVVGRTLPAIASTPDGHVYVFGGSYGGEMFYNSVEVMDPAFTASKAALSMFVAREGASATLLFDQRILVAGGRGSSFSPQSSTELFSSFDNGAACSWAGECASGTCVDGVCCATTCGACLRCDIPGKEGSSN
ncbi:MAG: Kelch repeat-containing protein, partial [Polyangiales bacterium]